MTLCSSDPLLPGTGSQVNARITVVSPPWPSHEGLKETAAAFLANVVAHTDVIFFMSIFADILFLFL